MALIVHIEDEQALVAKAMDTGARVYAILRACYQAMRTERYLAFDSERERDAYLRTIVAPLAEDDEDYLDLASEARLTPLESWRILEENTRPLIGFTSYDRFAAAFECAETAPALILLDLHLDATGARSGLLALAALKKRFPDVPVVVLSQFSEDDQIASCYAAGANEYQFKGGAQFERVLVRILSHWLRSPSLRSGEEAFLVAPAIQTSASNLDSYRLAPDELSPPIPEALVRSIAGRNAVLALGAGVSAFSGIPTGRVLLRHLIGHFAPILPEPLSSMVPSASPSEDFDRQIQNLGGTAKVMDAVAAAAPRAELAEVMARVYSTGARDNALISALYRCPWRAVVSLTWDDLADRTLISRVEAEPQSLRVVTVHDSAYLQEATRSGEIVLYKAFGTLDRPTTLALTVEEMRRLVQRAPAFQRALAGLYQSETFLFVGAAVDTIEQFLLAITPESEALSQKHFAIVERHPSNGLRQAALARFGVQLLEFESSAATGSLVGFVRRLRYAVQDAMPNLWPEVTDRKALSEARIRHVRLESIGPFDRLDLTLDAGDKPEAEAPWSVVFGRNGVGKTTILRAIALALAGDYPDACAAGERLLRSGAAEGMIEVGIGDQILRTRLTRDRARVLVQSLQQTPVDSGTALILGFPALRGARTPNPSGPSLQGLIRRPDPADLVALIRGDVDGRLTDFKQWVVNVLVSASGAEDRSQTMLGLLNAIVRDLVPGKVNALAPLAEGEYTIHVDTPEGIIPFEDLSQGMASIFNWVGLLMQRLFTMSPNATDPAQQGAILLIDEIDTHLHPDWQRRLVMLTRRFFPNVQIIATSHSPLLAGSLRPQEIVVLERDALTNAVVHLREIGDPFGLQSHDILTGPLFGMATDRNPEIESLVVQYFTIFQKFVRTQAEEAQLRTLHDELRKFRYGGPDIAPPSLPELSADDAARLGWTSVVQ